MIIQRVIRLNSNKIYNKNEIGDIYKQVIYRSYNKQSAAYWEPWPWSTWFSSRWVLYKIYNIKYI